MLGRVRWSEGRKLRVETEDLLGLTVPTLYLPKRLADNERRVRKGLRLLAQCRVNRLLAPPGFEWWLLAEQIGLHPVDTGRLRCALAPGWMEAVLKARGMLPEQAVLCLRGARESPDMERVARLLCPRVRNLVVVVPGAGALAATLQKEFGLPVLPVRATRADLILDFAPEPTLEGAKYGLRVGCLPSDCEELPLLSALWENGRICAEEIAIWL